MRNARDFGIGILCLALLSLSGCGAIRSTNGAKPRPVTPIENVMVWNASLAQTNLAVAQGIIAANNENAIDVATSNTILTAQSKIADADRQLTPILAGACQIKPQAPLTGDLGGPSTLVAPTPQNCNLALLSGQADTIQNFLSSITSAAQTMAATGTAQIKNLQTQQAVGQAIATLNTLLGQIVGALKTAGVLK